MFTSGGEHHPKSNLITAWHIHADQSLFVDREKDTVYSKTRLATKLLVVVAVLHWKRSGHSSVPQNYSSLLTVFVFLYLICSCFFFVDLLTANVSKWSLDYVESLWRSLEQQPGKVLGLLRTGLSGDVKDGFLATVMLRLISILVIAGVRRPTVE